MTKRAVVVTTLALMLGITGPACGKNPGEPADAVRAALRRTASEPRRFSYTEVTSERTVAVDGVVEDDYRYKVAVSVDDAAAYDEVARDDALAVRFAAPELIGSVSLASAAPSAAVQDALRTRRWVTDPVGAPDLTGAAALTRPPGEDPVLDGLTLAAYVSKAIGEAESVRRFNPEAIDYIAREDRFPKPEDGSGVTRFDLRPPTIPAPGGVRAGGLPGLAHLRRMSVYVKGGVVTNVLEDIDVGSRLDRLLRLVDVKAPPRASRVQRAQLAVAALNRQRASQGSALIRIRRMSAEFIDVGRSSTVELPGETITGSLNVIRNRGRTPKAATTTTAPSQPQPQP